MRIVLLLAVLSLWIPVRAATAAPPGKPNIIFVLADDLGIDGVSCYGADQHKTPNIDALAKTGLRFQTCYACPLCGPTRCEFLTGRYPFRTGGLTNQSWRNGGPGAKSADERPIAKVLKEAGYATGQAGKWRQVGESPREWGFDEFITDNTAGGWYWETKYNKNGETITLPEGSYGPNVVEEFAFDFIRRHKEQPFFFYYATHLVHKPTLKTPDTSAGTKNVDRLYDDNIRYMDKQVGELVAELERQGLREKTLIVFAGDNGTAAGYPSPVHGRMINGWKASMWEGGSRVPLIANWPGVVPQGKVSEDIISIADPYPTFAELAGVKLPDNFTIDGRSFAPQLRGEAGSPRPWAYVQLGARWFVREPKFKLDQAGHLYDLSDAPFVEKLIEPTADTEESKAARGRLADVLKQLDPAGGKKDRDADIPATNRRPDTARAAGPWKLGDKVSAEEAPEIAHKSLEISAEIDPTGADGLIVSQGGGARGYALYLEKGKLVFAVRSHGQLATVTGKEPLGAGHFAVQAKLAQDGSLALLVDGKPVADGKADGLIEQQPRAGVTVGEAGKAVVGDYTAPFAFPGKIANVRVTAAAAR